MSGKKPNTKGFTQGAQTALAGFTSGSAAQGNVMHILSEVMVTNAVRLAMKRPTLFLESLETHAYASYLLGGLDFSDVKEAPEREKGDTSGKIFGAAKKGFTQIPAAVAGYVAKEIRKNGPKFPGIMNNEVFYLIVGKILSAPIYDYLLGVLPKGSNAAAQVFDAIVARRKQIAKA